MKKFLLLILLVNLPTFGMCSIDNLDEVCSLPGFREQVSPTYNPRNNIREFSSSPEARLKSIDRSDISKQVRDFAPVESDFNYNSSCQFGVCLQDRSTPLFEQPKY